MINSLVIIDDDPVINEMLFDLASDYLKVPVLTYTSAEGFFASDINAINCIYVVDWNLPGMQGPEIIRNIRKHDKISPVFMISGNHSKEHVLEGLAAGADDYLIKPFEPEELLHKIQNARTRSNSIYENHINHGFKVIPEGNLVIKDGEKVHLTDREFQVFQILKEKKDRVSTRSEIVSTFHDNETTERNIDVLVYNLRKKILKIGIEVDTVRGQGYKLSNVGP